MVMKRFRILRYVSVLLLLCSSATLSAAPLTTASEVLRLATEQMKKCASVEATFTALHGEFSLSGTVVVEGAKFMLISGEVSTWFDGKTQWAYSPELNEVNVSEPTDDELAQINPLAIMSLLQSGYNARRIAASAGYDRIELTPKRKGGYLKIEISFNSATHFPSELVFVSSDNSVTTIKIKSIKDAGKQAASKFQFSPMLYPGVEVVDLR